MSGTCIEVPPLSRIQIRQMARDLRARFGINEPWFPIVEFMEVYQLVDSDFCFDIRDDAEMQDTHGLTYPDDRVMLIKEDVYNRAADKSGRDRMTIAHEFGHLLLHANLGLARAFPEDQLKPFCSSEWQAKCFAGELLIPVDHIHLCSSPLEVAAMFGVSLDAAIYQWNVYKKEGLIK